MIRNSFFYEERNLCDNSEDILASWGVVRNKQPKNPTVSAAPEVNIKEPSKDIYTPGTSKDGKDDGKISFKEKMTNFGKGFIAPVKNAFSSPKNIAITLASIAAGAALIVATGGAAAPVMVAAGLVGGGVQIGKGIYNQAKAKTDEQARQAWQKIGSGTFSVGLSAAGAKSALKTSGVNTEGMSTLSAVTECLKTAPKNLLTSVRTVGGKLSGLFSSSSASTVVNNPNGTRVFEGEVIDAPKTKTNPVEPIKKPEIIDVEYTVVEDTPIVNTAEQSIVAEPKLLPEGKNTPQIDYNSLYNSESGPKIDVTQYSGEHNLPAVVRNKQPINNPAPSMSAKIKGSLKRLFNLFGFFTSK